MDEGLLEAARAIRPYLNELVGPAAPELDERIAHLLRRAEGGEDVAGELRFVLGTHRATAVFAQELIDDPDHLPPDLQLDYVAGTTRGGGGQKPPGTETVRPGRFVCPRGDYVWYRRSVSDPIPTCPTDGETLRRG